MNKNNISNRLKQSSIIWSSSLTILYFTFLVIGSWLHLSVIQALFKFAFYLLFFIILVGNIIVLRLKNRGKLENIITIISMLLFSVGSCSLLWSPTVIAKGQHLGYTYYLVLRPKPLDARNFITLYECKNYGLTCHQTLFSVFAYPTGVVGYELGEDSANNEITISAIYDNGNVFLVYTNGNQSRHYEYPERMGNNLIYPAYYRNTDPSHPYTNTYLLYQCNLDNTDCKRVPFEFTKRGINDQPLLVPDESTMELHLYIENDLIYTYGEHSRCHVEGCIITIP